MYKISNNPPDTPEWLQDRIGQITASVFSKVITNTGKLSSSHDELVNHIVAEIIMDEPDVTFVSEAMERGTELEEEALRFFNFTYDYNFNKCGFVSAVDNQGASKGFGCSPDGIDEENGVGIELKCPLAHTHLSYLANGGIPKRHVHQVQGGMLVTGFEKWIFGSYHPHFPALHVSVERNKKIIEPMEEHLKFCVKLVRERLNKLKTVLEAA